MLRHPYARPLPALLLLAIALGLSLLFDGEPGSQEPRRQGLRELACVIGIGGAACYWCALLLGRAGLLHYRGSSFAMREPSEAELNDRARFWNADRKGPGVVQRVGPTKDGP